MNAPAQQKPQTLAEQVEAHRETLAAELKSLDIEIASLKYRRADIRAELEALPVQRARRKRQPKS